jgi:hypothetical protein
MIVISILNTSTKEKRNIKSIITNRYEICESHYFDISVSNQLENIAFLDTGDTPINFVFELENDTTIVGWIYEKKEKSQFTDGITFLVKEITC